MELGGAIITFMGVGMLAFFFLGLVFAFAAMSTPAMQPKLFWLLWLFTLLSWGLAEFLLTPAAHAWLLPEQCEYHLKPVLADPEPGIVMFAIIGAFLLGGALWFRHLTLATFSERIKKIEGDLPKRLEDGSLRLLKVAWLLERPSDWILLRRQKLPEEAFWSNDHAKRLLGEYKVAALSYRWLSAKHSDPNRFHLNQVLEYFRSGSNAQAHTAVMIDYCALPQKDPELFDERETPDAQFDLGGQDLLNEFITGLEGKRRYIGGEAYENSRTDEETTQFKGGLKVMSNAYASPRVLVLQQKKMQPELERELNEMISKGEVPPEDRRSDLIPYAGKHCRSGWCTSETACAMLMTAGGGHAYELGVGKAPVSFGELPSEEEMKKLFELKSTRFIGNADRKTVSDGYLKLRKDLEAYDEQRVPWLVRKADESMKGDDNRAVFIRVFLVVSPLVLVGVGILSVGANVGILSVGAVLLPFAFPLVAVLTLSSRIVRAHLAAVLCCRKRDSLDYTFHCSLCKAPFRKRTKPKAESVVPDCFLPPSERSSRATTSGSARDMEHRPSHGKSNRVAPAAEDGVAEGTARGAEEPPAVEAPIPNGGAPPAPPPPAAVGSAGVRAALLRLNLEQYADMFDELGYDDLPYLIKMGVEARGEVATEVGLKPGHARKFVELLGEA